jgi:phosphoglycolate phosphatase
MKPSALRGVIFDKDGTLFDLQATWAVFAGSFLRDLAGADDMLFEVLAAETGYDPVTQRLLPGSIIIAETPAVIAQAILPHLPDPPGWSDLIERMNTTATRAEMQPAVPLAPLLDGLLGRGVALGVATNDAEAPARAHLTASGILDRFAFVAGYDSGFGAKPAPGQLLAFAEALALEPAEVAMVGDSAHDLMAGRAAGMVTVAVLTGAAEAAALSPLADAVLPDIGALPDWIDRRF